MTFADKPITRRNALKEGAKIVTLGLMGGMLASGAGGGLSLGQTDGLYIRKNITADEIATTQGSLWKFKYPNVSGREIDLDPANYMITLATEDPSIFVQISARGVITAYGRTTLGSIPGFQLLDTDSSLNALMSLDSPFFNVATNAKLNLAGGGVILDDGSLGTTASVTVNSITPAQVGLPTATAGVAQGLNRPDHRHAFSGRFVYAVIDPAAILPGGVFPDNIARIKINNAWTLRRIWVYTKNGPTGGTETYGIVNAAGALQGTAVVLPAGPGVSQAESALQVTNLVGGTLYYVAQTAAGAGVVAASVNTQIGLEYTMNV